MHPHANTPERFWSLLDRASGCWLWTGGQNVWGYGQWNYQGKVIGAHRLAWMLTHGPIPHGLSVLHRCDTPLCCNPDHLFLGTQADNMADKARKGRSAAGERHGSRTHPERLPRGERPGSAKLTPEQVSDLRTRYAAGGVTYKELAALYGISTPQACAIVLRRKWGHI